MDIINQVILCFSFLMQPCIITAFNGYEIFKMRSHMQVCETASKGLCSVNWNFLTIRVEESEVKTVDFETK